MTEQVLIQVPLYDPLKHYDLIATTEQVAALVDGLPEDMRKTVHESGARTVGFYADVLRDYMGDHVYKCHRRPALPHEDGGFYLTTKGEAKYKERLFTLSKAFESAFGLRPWRKGRKSPVEGPIDPLTWV